MYKHFKNIYWPLGGAAATPKVLVVASSTTTYKSWYKYSTETFSTLEHKTFEGV